MVYTAVRRNNALPKLSEPGEFGTPVSVVLSEGKGKMETFWLEGRKDPANHLNSAEDSSYADHSTVNISGPNDANVTQVTEVIAVEEEENLPYVTKLGYGYQVAI
ncbi:hypothetical protein HOLleu_33069 [Holothuria leucospilota]|uniref:Uncharacterized protein n=1 Tax=Holothuria leucospilota TaxID=206669 RepID=A0A9Q0YN21_HOLLE|nr:hypothetical protein HOLleu_33069 [Holothuria leucospilota]